LDFMIQKRIPGQIYIFPVLEGGYVKGPILLHSILTLTGVIIPTIIGL